MAAEKPFCARIRAWLKARDEREQERAWADSPGSGTTHQAVKRYNTAPLTGQDWRAIACFVHAIDLSATDETGRRMGIAAAAAAVQAMQPSTRYLAKACIPMVLDWSDEERLWGQIDGLTPPLPSEVEEMTAFAAPASALLLAHDVLALTDKGRGSEALDAAVRLAYALMGRGPEPRGFVDFTRYHDDQESAPKPAEPPPIGWTCACGSVNGFDNTACHDCTAPRPSP